MTNKAFKSDSQRLKLSLRSSIAKRCSHLSAALCSMATKTLVKSSATRRYIGNCKYLAYLKQKNTKISALSQ